MKIIIYLNIFYVLDNFVLLIFSEDSRFDFRGSKCVEK